MISVLLLQLFLFSSFFCKAKLLESSSEARINSSAKHSATDFLFLNADCKVPLVKNPNERSTLLCGEMSTATWYPIPPYLIRVVSSRGEVFSTAVTKT